MVYGAHWILIRFKELETQRVIRKFLDILCVPFRGRVWVPLDSKKTANISKCMQLRFTK